MHAYSQHTPSPTSTDSSIPEQGGQSVPRSSQCAWFIMTLAATLCHSTDHIALNHCSSMLILQALCGCGVPGWYFSHQSSRVEHPAGSCFAGPHILTLPSHWISPWPSALHHNPEAEAGSTLHILYPLFPSPVRTSIA